MSNASPRLTTHQNFFTNNNFYTGFIVVLSILVSIGMIGCEKKLTPEQIAENERIQQESDKLQAEINHELHINEISQPFTQTDYPHLYDQWGKDWMDIINTMLPLAAERVQSQPECRQVSSIDLSAHSEVGVNPILHVQCDNAEYYYVSLGDIAKEKRLLPASKLFGKKPSDYIDKCIDAIKPNLMYPKSMVYDTVNTSLEVSASNPSTVEVTIPYTVKTGFNTQVKHLAKCMTDGEKNVSIEMLSVQ